ncbi:c6 transcription factor [Trichoderma arundinaceum]|uniref:C6 transcription factor n=1 Tax=Trichoderma arundinaceum TaxID=490622 RepID=A0A395NYL5_TRIAR|nr:c6 transcription factor [Trichoderma arundinaceum]
MLRSGRHSLDALADGNFESGLACVYREKGQPGLLPGHGKAIEQRLTLLEDNVERINQSIQDVLNYVRTEAIAKSTMPMPGPDIGVSAPVTIEKTSDSAQDILSPVRRDIAADTPLPQAVNSAPVASPINDTQVWPVSQQLQEVGSLALSPVNTFIDQLPSSHAVHRLETFSSGLPSSGVMQELVELFFELVYPWVPLFFKPSFVANMYAPERQILLHGIVIIAFRFWRKADPSTESREAYVKASPKHLNLSKKPSPASIETNTPLVRNEDPDEGLDSSSIETEERRRLFWVIYSIDRLSSVFHSQPGGTETKNIRLPYPAYDEDWGQTVPPEWFQYKHSDVDGGGIPLHIFSLFKTITVSLRSLSTGS